MGDGFEANQVSDHSVVTQFEANAMRQFFVQNGARIDIPTPTWEGLPDSNEVNPALCDVLFDVFDDYDRYSEVGGWPAISEAASLPQVLVLSIWADVSDPPFITIYGMWSLSQRLLYRRRGST